MAKSTGKTQTPTVLKSRQSTIDLPPLFQSSLIDIDGNLSREVPAPLVLVEKQNRSQIASISESLDEFEKSVDSNENVAPFNVETNEQFQPLQELVWELKNASMQKQREIIKVKPNEILKQLDAGRLCVSQISSEFRAATEMLVSTNSGLKDSEAEAMKLVRDGVLRQHLSLVTSLVQSVLSQRNWSLRSWPNYFDDVELTFDEIKAPTVSLNPIMQPEHPYETEVREMVEAGKAGIPPKTPFHGGANEAESFVKTHYGHLLEVYGAQRDFLFQDDVFHIHPNRKQLESLQKSGVKINGMYGDRIWGNDLRKALQNGCNSISANTHRSSIFISILQNIGFRRAHLRLVSSTLNNIANRYLDQF